MLSLLSYNRGEKQNLFGAANTADSAAANGAGSLGNRLTVFRKAFSRILHGFLFFAFHTISFYGHSFSFLG